jgi:hypothetical protein
MFQLFRVMIRLTKVLINIDGTSLTSYEFNGRHPDVLSNIYT